MMLWVLVLFAGMMVGFLQAGRIATQRVAMVLDSSRDEHARHLATLIDVPLLVPEILAMSKPVRALLSQPTSAAATEQNEILEEMARAVHLDVIYLMDLNGDTLAASNWREKDSFVGHNYQFRPYFQQAISGRTGRYTAQGVTSGKLGVYLARPVSVEGKIRGAVVVKISLEAMHSRVEELWRRSKEIVLVTDENGVIILSPVSALTFKAMQAMPEAARKAIEASRQYGGEISAVSLRTGDALNEQLRFVDFEHLPDQSFLQTSYELPELGLRLYLHLPASRYWKIVAEFTAMFSLAALVVLLFVLSLVQRGLHTAELFETAIRDPLTGLNTRLYMNEWCDAAVRAHNRDPGKGFGLVVFDLDLFKKVNDVHGHLAGDEVLRGVGEIIRSAIRGADLAVRFGGEELAVFVHCADQAEALAFAERIRLRVEQTEFPGKTGRIPVTVSGGVAYHAVDETLDQLFARADEKLYRAKEQGRNRIRD